LTGMQTAPTGAVRRNRAQALMALIIAVLGLLACVVLLVFDVRDSGLISAYQSASNCSSPSDALNGDACRYQGQAQVISTSRQTRLEAVISFAALPGRTFSTSFPTNDEPDSSALKAGASVAGELWNGKVTRLAGKATVDDPEGYPTSALLEIAALLAVLSLPLLAIGIWLARSA
jgi:hypothetical protein